MRQANTVMTIFGFTSVISSGSAYTRAPVFRAIEMAYFAFARLFCNKNQVQDATKRLFTQVPQFTGEIFTAICISLFVP
jgi:hypothetical protein